MQLMILWVSLLLTVLFAGAATSAAVLGLYQAQVPLQQDSAAQREVAQRQAFAEVLTKLTGIGGLVYQTQYADLLELAPRYVQRYQVKQAPSAGDNAALLVHFDPQAMQQFVRTQGLPVWSETRPSSLLLVAIEQGVNRSLLSNENDPALRGVVMGAAQQRAIPVILPLFDIEDQRSLNISDLWGGFFDRMAPIRDRYGASNLLIGRAVHEGLGWRIRWSLMVASGAIEHWDTTANNFHHAVEQGVDGLADRLAQRYAVVQGGVGSTGQLYVAVEQIRSLQDYARVTKYLQQLSPVSQLQVKQISPDEVVFQLGIMGEAAGLRRAIETEPLLLPVLSYRDDLGQAANNPLQTSQANAYAGALRYRLVQ